MTMTMMIDISYNRCKFNDDYIDIFCKRRKWRMSMMTYCELAYFTAVNTVKF